MRSTVLLSSLLILWASSLPALSQEFPTLTLTPDAGPVGERVTATGDRFDRDTDVVLRFDGQVVATVAANGPDWTDADSFQTTFTVPDRPADPSGGYDVVAHQDGEPLARHVFTVEPTLTIDPTRGPGGSEVDLRGTGWDPDEVLTIDFPAGSTVATIGPGDDAWNGNSRFAVTLTVPSLRSETHPVEVHQFERKLLREVAFTVVPTLTLDPVSGRVGDLVDVSGTGYDRDFDLELVFDGESVATIPAGAPEWTSETTFTASFRVPERPDGPYLVEALQDCSRSCDISANARFSVSPVSLTIEPREGPIGTVVTADGGGWHPDLPVRLTFDGATVATIGAGDVTPAGRFVSTFEVPDRTAGNVTVEACQRCDSDDRIDAQVEFRVLAVLTVDPPSGSVGSAAAVSGEAFDRSLPLRLEFDGETVTTVPGGTSEFTDDVRFASELTVPDRPAGPHEVSACQRCGTETEIRASTTFTVVPSLVFEPDLGPPGFVTMAVGRGFPTGEPIELVWAPGVGRALVTAASDGSFRAPFLVHNRDRPGPRSGRALLPANADRPADQLIEEPEAPFLVVPGTLQPADFVARR